jgi:serine phosphatase RsbU (regulator of sigma subunit)
LTTDSLYEWEDQWGEQFGPKRLEDVIRPSSGCSSDEIIQALYKAVLEFSDGTTQQDDLTAVVTLLFKQRLRFLSLLTGLTVHYEASLRHDCP